MMTYCCDPVEALDCDERVECSIVRDLGHSQCGMCSHHDAPRHRCGCVVVTDSEELVIPPSQDPMAELAAYFESLGVKL